MESKREFEAVMTSNDVVLQRCVDEMNVFLVGDKEITFKPTKTRNFLAIQSKAQGSGGKFSYERYVDGVLERVVEKIDMDEFLPSEIQELVAAFEYFCNAGKAY